MISIKQCSVRVQNFISLTLELPFAKMESILPQVFFVVCLFLLKIRKLVYKNNVFLPRTGYLVFYKVVFFCQRLSLLEQSFLDLKQNKEKLFIWKFDEKNSWPITVFLLFFPWQTYSSLQKPNISSMAVRGLTNLPLSFFPNCYFLLLFTIYLKSS